MMGEVGFVALGVDWTQGEDHPQLVATGSTPNARRWKRHARALLHRAGADAEDRQALRVGDRRSDSGVPLMATIQDFDWADEVLHSQIGRAVVRPRVRQPARRRSTTATQRWSKILSNWATVKEKGLTQARELVAGGVPHGLRRGGRLNPIPWCWRSTKRMRVSGPICNASRRNERAKKATEWSLFDQQGCQSHVCKNWHPWHPCSVSFGSQLLVMSRHPQHIRLPAIVRDTGQYEQQVAQPVQVDQAPAGSPFRSASA